MEYKAVYEKCCLPVLKWVEGKLDSEVSTKGVEVSEKDLGAEAAFFQQ